MEKIKTQKEIRGEIYNFLSSKGFDMIEYREELKKLLVEYAKIVNIPRNIPNKTLNYQPAPITDEELKNIE